MIDANSSGIIQINFARTLLKLDSLSPEWVTSKSSIPRIYAADFHSDQHGYGEKDMRKSGFTAIILGLCTGFFGTSAVFMALYWS